MTETVKKPVSIKKTILRLLLYFVVLDVCVITLYPYFAMLCTALKERSEIFSGGTILPVTALWSNFIDIWSRAPMSCTSRIPRRARSSSPEP